MAEPLNDNGVSFALNFINDGAGRIDIDEPLQFDALNFVLEQDDNRYGRDVSFAGGEFGLRFDQKSNQNISQLQRLLDYNDIYGFESNVQFIVTVNNSDYVAGKLDFQSAVTDGLSYFETNVIQETTQALLKRRSDIKIDMFSTVNVGGEVIAPLTTNNVFLRAKTILSISEWTSPLIFSRTIGLGESPIRWNSANQVLESAIENTLSFIVDTTQTGEFIRLIESQSTLTDVVLSISNITLTQLGIGVETDVVYRIGSDFNTATEQEAINLGTSDLVNFSAQANINNLRSGQSLWVYFRTTGNNGDGIILQSGATINIEANETPVSTITPSIPIQNIISQVVLSTTGMAAIFSTAFSSATDNESCFNGLALRGFDPDNFYVSFEDITAWMQEINADFQIQDNDTVFFGLYGDFYPNNEAGSYTLPPPESFKVTYNRRYTINKFTYEYDKFEDDKNTEDNNALTAIHTQSEWTVPNNEVQNKKGVDVPFIRDAALIDSTRRFNIQSDNENATQNDEDVFIVDIDPDQTSIVNEYNFNAFVTVSGNAATFVNRGGFSFIATGLSIGLPVTFDADDGTFTATGNVTAITSTSVTIFDGGLSGIVSGQYITNFSFTVTAAIARTDEGFDSITSDGADGNGFVNILYSPKRNILNYWGAYLNTASNFVQGGTIRNTFFINNADLTSQFDGGEVLREGDDIIVSDLNTRILAPYIYQTTIYIDFEEFQTIVSNIRVNRGFLRIADNNERVVQIFPQILNYDWENNALEVTGEQRFESDFLTITTQDGIISINEVGYDTDLIIQISWLFVDDFVYLYDSEGVLLTNRKRFDFVEVNGNTFNSPEDLAEALENLNP